MTSRSKGWCEPWSECGSDVDESEPTERFQLLNLDALVRMKPTSFRDKDRAQLRDLLEIGLIDEKWVAILPLEIAARLQQLIDHPE